MASLALGALLRAGDSVSVCNPIIFDGDWLFFFLPSLVACFYIC